MKVVLCTKYGSPEVLQVMEVANPVPKDDEVLIRIHSALVGATDPVNRKGLPMISRLFTGLSKPKQPILGTEFSGEIVEIGKDVTLFKKGDRVMGATGLDMGAQAEFKTVPEKYAIALKPTNMTYGEAAALSDGGLTALPFLRDKGEIKKDDQVLIIGASGAVGSVAVQLAKYYGANVTAVCSGSNAQWVKVLGADRVIDYTREDFTTGPERYDIIFDTVAKSSYAVCKPSLSATGIYLTTTPTLSAMFGSKNKKKKRASFMAAGMRSTDLKVKDMAFLKELVESGHLKSVIDRVYPLEQIADAHRYVEQGHKKGNVILDIYREAEK